MQTNEFIDLVKVSTATPDSQSTFTDQEILSIAFDEMKTKVLPMVISVREEYFLVQEDMPLVAAQASYAIPKRAVAGKVHEITLVDLSGRESNLGRLDQSEISQMNFSSGEPRHFLFRGSKVVLYPTPSNSSQSLRVTYYQRPNKLVLPSSASQITAIDPNTNTITVSSLTNSGFVTNAKVDLVQNTYGYDVVGKDLSIQNISGSDVQFSSLPSDLEVGDWLCLAQESPVVQLPDEVSGYLVALTARRLLEAQTDSQAYKMLDARVMQIEKDMINLLSPRIVGEPKKIFNPHSFLRW